MIKWLFKEWLYLIESYAASGKKRNFEQLYLLLIKNFLDSLLEFGKAKPNYFKPEQEEEIEKMSAGSDFLYDILFFGTGGYTTTILNDTNYSTAFDEKYENTVKMYLKDGGDYLFKKFNTYDEYLKFAGTQKSVQFGSAVSILHNTKELIISTFLKPLINSYQRKVKGSQVKQIVGDSDTEMSADSFGDKEKVTRRREEESEAMIQVAPLFECIRTIYRKISEKLKEEIQSEIEGLYTTKSSTIKNLPSLKRKLHKFFAASYVSGKEPGKSDIEIGDDNVTDSEFGKLIHNEERNLSSLLLLRDKFKEFFNRQKIENPEQYNAMIDVCGTLYYIGILKNLAVNKQTGKLSQDIPVVQKKKLRQEFLDAIPETLKSTRFTEDRLKDFSTLSTSNFPQMSYDATLEELKSKGFENLMPELAMSYSFPTNYMELLQDDGNTGVKSKVRVDAMNQFFKPIFEILGNKKTIKELQSIDCDEIIAHYENKGLI